MTDIPEPLLRQLIASIATGLSRHPLVLKDDSALMLAFNLDRCSTEICYDSNTRIELTKELEKMLQTTRLNYRVVTKEDTDSLSKSVIHYGSSPSRTHTLKIEIANNREIPPNEVSKTHGFPVYTINKLCRDKLSAIAETMKPTDFYDLGFIAYHSCDELDDQNLFALQELSHQTRTHDLYEYHWPKDEFVSPNSFQGTIDSLASIRDFLQRRPSHNQISTENTHFKSVDLGR